MSMSVVFSGVGYDSNDVGKDGRITKSFSSRRIIRSSLRSISFNGRDSDTDIRKELGCRKLVIKRSRSWNWRGMNPSPLKTNISMKRCDSVDYTSAETDTGETTPVKRRRIELPSTLSDKPKHEEAAVKLQKVYKSFRTRRQLADCAVLVEQSWWKLLDFALLRLSSVSFFDIDKQESALSKWSRARTKAAKVGKGLLKDKKARKLALQHWLEAIDPRHRYGHNLHFYYAYWLHCESRQPFFYWLDVGDGKLVNLKEQCARSKLQQQCIKYLGPKERESYEVIIQDAKFMYKKNRELVDTTNSPKHVKWIFVLSTAKTLYVGQKNKGTFQHSSFLAGGATSAAGRLVVEDGILRAVWPHSGHYRPTDENFQEFMNFLKENNVNLTNVKRSPSEDEEEQFPRSYRNCSNLNLPESNLFDKDEEEVMNSYNSADRVATTKTDLADTVATVKTNFSLQIPNKVSGSSFADTELAEEITPEHSFYNQVIKDPEESDDELDIATASVTEQKPATPDSASESMEDPSGLEPPQTISKEKAEESLRVPEPVLQRINSKKGMRSYQLGKQLSCKWTTGAGPRIGCVRDYPSELQLHALEQVSLSPRSMHCRKSRQDENLNIHWKP